jgi:hypothetical protein
MDVVFQVVISRRVRFARFTNRNAVSVHMPSTYRDDSSMDVLGEWKPTIPAPLMLQPRTTILADWAIKDAFRHDPLQFHMGAFLSHSIVTLCVRAQGG